MPVRKYKDATLIPPPPLAERGSAEHIRRLRALWQRTTRLAPRRMKPGLYRFRSTEEAETARQEAGTGP